MQLSDVSDRHKTLEGDRGRILTLKLGLEAFIPDQVPSALLTPGEASEPGPLPSALSPAPHPGPGASGVRSCRSYAGPVFAPGPGQRKAGGPQPGLLTTHLLPQVPLRCPDLGRRKEVLCPGGVQPPAGLRPRGGTSCREPPSGSSRMVREHTRPAPLVGWKVAAGLMDEGPRHPLPET